MAESESFTFVNELKQSKPQLFEQFHGQTSAKIADVDVQLVTELRTQYPDLIVTFVPCMQHSCSI